MFIDQNTADAISKALDLAKQGVVTGFEMVKNYAPYVWGVARRQVILEGIENLFSVGVIYTIAYAIRTLSLSCIDTDSDGYKGDWSANNAHVLNTVTFCLATFIASFFIVRAISYVFNPDYWTMRFVLDLANSVHQ